MNVLLHWHKHTHTHCTHTYLILINNVPIFCISCQKGNSHSVSLQKKKIVHNIMLVTLNSLTHVHANTHMHNMKNTHNTTNTLTIQQTHSQYNKHTQNTLMYTYTHLTHAAQLPNCAAWTQRRPASWLNWYNQEPDQTNTFQSQYT